MEGDQRGADCGARRSDGMRDVTCARARARACAFVCACVHVYVAYQLPKVSEYEYDMCVRERHRGQTAATVSLGAMFLLSNTHKNCSLLFFSFSFFQVMASLVDYAETTSP